MKWDFFYDETKETKSPSKGDFEQETSHIQWTLFVVLLLTVLAFVFFSIFPIA